jgi:hypothetical protein
MTNEANTVNSRVAELSSQMDKVTFQIRQLEAQQHELNFIVFPKPNSTTKRPTQASIFTLAAAQEHHLLQPLGLAGFAKATDLKIIRSRPTFKLIRCETMTIKLLVMKAVNRRIAADRYNLLVKDDLTPDEKQEQQLLRPVMQYLYSQNRKPGWMRSTITWSNT